MIMTILFFAIFLIRDFIITQITIANIFARLLNQKIMAWKFAKNKFLILIEKSYKRNNNLI